MEQKPLIDFEEESTKVISDNLEQVTRDSSKDPKETTDSEEAKSKDDVTKLFEDFLEKESLFVNKKVLQIRYIPDTIKHRSKQIEILASILAPALRKEKPSNLFLYGKTGTGKTLCTTYALNKLKKIAEAKDIPINMVYLNCKLKKIADTEYRVIAQLAREIGSKVPTTGLPTDEVYNIFLRKLDENKQIIIIVLDEIDQLVTKIGDEMLYTLTRINQELKQAQLSIVGISNDVRFIENIDPRVKSSLGEEEIIFPPYNAIELREILQARAKEAFREDVITEGVLEKCSAYAAREHGDARRAIELLRVAGELAERENLLKITPKQIDSAEDKIERSRIIEIIETQPKQSQIVMYAILLLLEKQDGKLETGEVFEKYKELCKQQAINVLTQRRISDLISELDMLGLINAKIVSKGRYGRTREIYLTISTDMINKIKETLKKQLY